MKKLKTNEKILQYIIEHRGDCTFISCDGDINNYVTRLNIVPCPLRGIGCFLNKHPKRIQLAKEKLAVIQKLDFLEKLK